MRKLTDKQFEMLINLITDINYFSEVSVSLLAVFMGLFVGFLVFYFLKR